MNNTAQNTPQNIDIAQEIYKKNVQLLSERRRTELLLYSVSEIVFAVDAEYKITLLDHTAEKLLEIEDEDVLGKDVNDFIKIVTEKNVPIKAQEYCFQDDPKKSVVEGAIIKTAHGDRYINIRTSIISQEELTKECVVTMVDVTRERELDKTKDDFISITSHELRTPITIIKSYLWMLKAKKGGELTPKQEDYLDKAIRGTERMLALVNDTLNISRIEQGKVTIITEDVNLFDFLKEFDDEFKIKTEEKGLFLKNELVSGLWVVYADKMKLREVFLNFLGNSAKFTDMGGVTIKAENTLGSFVKVSIIDTGRGIKKEDLGRLFNKFGRLDNDYTTIAEKAGTGLGLYISKTLIEKMGGKVGVESEGVGKGTTFWFALPAKDPGARICSLAS